MATELPKQFDPREAQKRWLEFWDQRGYFHSRPDPARKPFTIVIPPPNVTGALHMGHALNNIPQDVLIRWRRMQGYNALWIPGTDHAGIGTQAVVERRLRDGSTYRVAKTFLDPQPLGDHLSALGWRADLRRLGSGWVLGKATPAP